MTTPAWTKLWDNVECLLKLPVFKEITLLEHSKGSKIPYNELINYTTKLEVGILGLLWCTGSQKAKANFIYKLAQPDDDPNVAWNDDELKIIFVRLVHFSIDTPSKWFQPFYTY